MLTLHRSPSRQGWALLLVVIALAAFLRFWQLSDLPPGFYRDEAYNGLDALGVLQSEHTLFFPANNGREPIYIYLTALSVQLFGRSVLAVRLAAAVAGTLTTLALYLLTHEWFGRRVALMAAWFWAVTFWPVHLSRIGLRTVLLALGLALTFWLGTHAYRQQRPILWFAAGLLYGLSYYTYLAIRFTPLLLGLLVLYLLARPEYRARLWPGVAYFLAGTALVLAPLVIFAWRNPALFTGRLGQVSVLNPAVNQGDLWGTLWRQGIDILGYYFWRGDMIWRHNLPGRPVFDLFLAIPFLLGLAYCLWHWRRPACLALLLWQAVMVGPSLLAEDAPHFLRLAGVLPALFILPAVGLSKLIDWPTLPPVSPPSRVPAGRWVMITLAVVICLGTLLNSVIDYFGEYAKRPETAMFFENAARSLATAVDEEAAGVTVFLDERYWNGSWPAVNFLVTRAPAVIPYQPEAGLPCRTTPAGCPYPLAIYAWPYTPLDFVAGAITPPALVTATLGDLAQGDLEPEPYPFFIRYHAAPPPAGLDNPVANFSDALYLWQERVTLVAADRLQVETMWTAGAEMDDDLVVFLHIIDESGTIVGQSDGPLAQSYWPAAWWQPGLWVNDRRDVLLTMPYDPRQHQMLLGIYNRRMGMRLPLLDEAGTPAGETWLLSPIE